MKKKGIIYILSSPSGGGKTTLSKMVRKKVYRLRNSISYTTRKKRAGEKEGKDYHFLSDEDFNNKIKDGFFAEWAIVHDNSYGTSLTDLRDIIDGGEDVLMDIDIQGTRQIKASFPEAVSIFIMPPSKEELSHRLRQRGTEEEKELGKRLKVAIREMAAYDEYDYLIINRRLESSLEDLQAIITAERLKTEKMKDDPAVTDMLSNSREDT